MTSPSLWQFPKELREYMEMLVVFFFFSFFSTEAPGDVVIGIPFHLFSCLRAPKKPFGSDELVIDWRAHWIVEILLPAPFEVFWIIVL